MSENPFTDLARMDVANDRAGAQAQVRFLGNLVARPPDAKTGQAERDAITQTRDALLKELIASAD